MRRTIITVIATVTVFVLVAGGQKPTTIPTAASTSPHYQLVTSGAEGGKVFLLDSHRGKVWVYQPGGHTEAAGDVPEDFLPVGIGMPRKGRQDWGLKKSAEEDQ